MKVRSGFFFQCALQAVDVVKDLQLARCFLRCKHPFVHFESLQIQRELLTYQLISLVSYLLDDLVNFKAVFLDLRNELHLNSWSCTFHI